MLKSLRFKILAAMVIVIIAGVVITALNATRSTTGEFQRYLMHGQTMRQKRFVVSLTNFYASEQSWTNVQSLVDQISGMSGERILVADSRLIIVGDSEGKLVGSTAGNNWNFKVPDPGGAIAGYLYINPLVEADTSTSDYIISVSRSVWLGAVIAILIAFFATLLISRSILHPVEELTVAARKMQSGDMSVRVNVESKDEIGVLGASFNAMVESVTKQEQLRKNMVSDVAHELRTPLSNILGYLEAANDGLVTPNQALVSNLFEEATLLNHLINDLQELAEADAGHLRLDITTIRLDEILQSAVDNFTPIVQKLGIQLSCDFSSDLPTVKADSQRVAQILRNLVGNALDYTPPEGKITLKAQEDKSFVRIEVIDTGTGIEAEHLPYIFERFYRADPSRARTSGGSGLWLAIVKQLAEAQGGQVGVESATGKGSTFYFTLPISRD